jgi:polysaccharide export outer membrane protein
MSVYRKICFAAAVVAACLMAGASVADETGKKLAQYQIGVEDVLEINVWKNPDVSRQVWVRPDGRITLPLIGDVVAKGLTTQQLVEALTARLKEYFTDPVVTVTLLEINSYTVYLLGRVEKPGEMKLRSPKTFLQVLAMAGGFQEFADTDSVVLVRWEAGQQRRIHVDAKDIIAKGSENDFLMRPGDVIIVP